MAVLGFIKFYAIGFVVMFTLVMPAHAEVEASLAAKYNFEKTKGIKWEDATDKTKRRWLATYKEGQANVQKSVDLEEANRKIRLKQLADARTLKKEQELERERARERERQRKRQALEAKRREVAQKKQAMIDAMKAMKERQKRR